MDELTYSTLYDAYRGIINSLPDSQFVGVARPYPGFVVTEGQSGEYVLSLQEYLNVIAQAYPEIPQIAEDGIFGPATAEAVRAFQTRFGFPVTGVVTFSVWNAIGSLYEDLERGAVVAEGQFSNDISME